MKKSLLALAVLGAFAGVASAQSSVTIYGLVDLSVAKSNGGTADNNNGQAGAAGKTNSNNANQTSQRNTGKAWTLQQSSTSRLGFRGNEDLGGGLSAQFQIEHRFNPDTGGQNNAGAFWAGRSYVQLTSAAAGSVYMGREYSPAFWPAVKSDPFGWDGVGQLGSNMWGSFRTVNPNLAGGAGLGNNVRMANAVGYKTPSLGGLTANVAVALGEGQVGRETGLNVEYGAGPVYAAFGYEKVKGAGAATLLTGNSNSRDGDSLINLALHYNFGVIKPMLYYSRSKVAATNATNKFVSIAALAPVGPGNVKVAYYRYDPQGNNNTESKLGLGYDYPFSKRTNVYADLGLTRSDLVVAGAKLTNNSTYAFGIKHTF